MNLTLINTENHKTIINTYNYKSINIIETKIRTKNNTNINYKLENSKKEFTPVLFKKSFDKNNIQETDFIELISDNTVKPDIKTLDQYDLYFAYYPGYILFDENYVPISTPLTFNYVGSLETKSRDDKIYKELIEKLKNHKFIRYLEEDYIPGYNSDFIGQTGIKKCISYISNKEYQKLYNKYKDNQFFSCRINDEIKMKIPTSIYGKEIEKLLTEYHKQETYYESSDENN